MTCSKCKHAYVDGLGNMECHRYPPTPFPVMQDATGIHCSAAFPSTSPTAHCGEFEARGIELLTR